MTSALGDGDVKIYKKGGDNKVLLAIEAVMVNFEDDWIANEDFFGENDVKL